jgi:endonuclease YncB( thermonuclease family)
MMTAGRGRKLLRDTFTVLALVAASVAVVGYLTPATQFSSVSVIDGDSLRSGMEEIRLHGIDAPEFGQTCTRSDGSDYACGRQATRHLKRLIANAPIDCRIIDTDRYNRTIAVCTAGGRELNLAMVEDGWAVAYTKHSLGYVAAEQDARDARRGIWQGWFEQPSAWRERNRMSLGTLGQNNAAQPD